MRVGWRPDGETKCGCHDSLTGLRRDIAIRQPNWLIYGTTLPSSAGVSYGEIVH